MINLFRKLIWNVSAKTGTFKGKERLLAFISRPRSLNRIRVERNGVSWLLNGHDLNEFYIAVRPHHSPLLIECLSKEIENRNVQVFWDIGANIGGISLPLLKKFSQLKGVLFEPSAEVAGRLIANLSVNPDLCNRAAVMNIALSDAEGISHFYVSNEPFNSSTGGLGFSHNRFQFAVG